jgi:electron transport complex protein RnfE
MKPSDIAQDGLWRKNPALVQLLGLCPLLAVSNTLINGLVLGLLTIFVLVGSNGVVSLCQKWLDETTRLPAQILIIATFVTLADLLLQSVSFELHQRIGLFVALIVTNCVILGRAESFARKQSFILALLDGFFMGLGFFFVIVALSALRELIGQGTLFAGAHLIFGPGATRWTLEIADNGLLLAALPPGAFLLFGLMIAFKNWIDLLRNEQRQKIRNTQAPQG